MSSLQAGFSVTETEAVSYDARNNAKRARLQGPEWVDSREERYSEALRDNCERDISTMSPQVEPVVQILVSQVYDEEIVRCNRFFEGPSPTMKFSPEVLTGEEPFLELTPSDDGLERPMTDVVQNTLSTSDMSFTDSEIACILKKNRIEMRDSVHGKRKSYEAERRSSYLHKRAQEAYRRPSAYKTGRTRQKTRMPKLSGKLSLSESLGDAQETKDEISSWAGRTTSMSTDIVSSTATMHSPAGSLAFDFWSHSNSMVEEQTHDRSMGKVRRGIAGAMFATHEGASSVKRSKSGNLKCLEEDTRRSSSRDFFQVSRSHCPAVNNTNTSLKNINDTKEVTVTYSKRSSSLEGSDRWKQWDAPCCSVGYGSEKVGEGTSQSNCHSVMPAHLKTSSTSQSSVGCSCSAGVVTVKISPISHRESGPLQTTQDSTCPTSSNVNNRRLSMQNTTDDSSEEDTRVGCWPKCLKILGRKKSKSKNLPIANVSTNRGDATLCVDDLSTNRPPPASSLYHGTPEQPGCLRVNLDSHEPTVSAVDKAHDVSNGEEGHVWRLSRKGPTGRLYCVSPSVNEEQPEEIDRLLAVPMDGEVYLQTSGNLSEWLFAQQSSCFERDGDPEENVSFSVDIIVSSKDNEIDLQELSPTDESAWRGPATANPDCKSSTLLELTWADDWNESLEVCHEPKVFQLVSDFVHALESLKSTPEVVSMARKLKGVLEEEDQQVETAWEEECLRLEVAEHKNLGTDGHVFPLVEEFLNTMQSPEEKMEDVVHEVDDIWRTEVATTEKTLESEQKMEMPSVGSTPTEGVLTVSRTSLYEFKQEELDSETREDGSCILKNRGCIDLGSHGVSDTGETFMIFRTPCNGLKSCCECRCERCSGECTRACEQRAQKERLLDTDTTEGLKPLGSFDDTFSVEAVTGVESRDELKDISSHRSHTEPEFVKDIEGRGEPDHSNEAGSLTPMLSITSEDESVQVAIMEALETQEVVTSSIEENQDSPKYSTNHAQEMSLQSEEKSPESQSQSLCAFLSCGHWRTYQPQPQRLSSTVEEVNEDSSAPPSLGQTNKKDMLSEEAKTLSVENHTSINASQDPKFSTVTHSEITNQSNEKPSQDEEVNMTSELPLLAISPTVSQHHKTSITRTEERSQPSELITEVSESVAENVMTPKTSLDQVITEEERSEYSEHISIITHFSEDIVITPRTSQDQGTSMNAQGRSEFAGIVSPITDSNVRVTSDEERLPNTPPLTRDKTQNLTSTSRKDVFGPPNRPKQRPCGQACLGSNTEESSSDTSGHSMTMGVKEIQESPLHSTIRASKAPLMRAASEDGTINLSELSVIQDPTLSYKSGSQELTGSMSMHEPGLAELSAEKGSFEPTLRSASEKLDASGICKQMLFVIREPNPTTDSEFSSTAGAEDRGHSPRGKISPTRIQKSRCSDRLIMVESHCQTDDILPPELVEQNREVFRKYLEELVWQETPTKQDLLKETNLIVESMSHGNGFDGDLHSSGKKLSCDYGHIDGKPVSNFSIIGSTSELCFNEETFRRKLDALPWHERNARHVAQEAAKLVLIISSHGSNIVDDFRWPIFSCGSDQALVEEGGSCDRTESSGSCDIVPTAQGDSTDLTSGLESFDGSGRGELSWTRNDVPCRSGSEVSLHVPDDSRAMLDVSCVVSPTGALNWVESTKERYDKTLKGYSFQDVVTRIRVSEEGSCDTLSEATQTADKRALDLERCKLERRKPLTQGHWSEALAKWSCLASGVPAGDADQATISSKIERKILSEPDTFSPPSTPDANKVSGIRSGSFIKALRIEVPQPRDEYDNAATFSSRLVNKGAGFKEQSYVHQVEDQDACFQAFSKKGTSFQIVVQVGDRSSRSNSPFGGDSRTPPKMHKQSLTRPSSSETLLEETEGNHQKSISSTLASEVTSPINKDGDVDMDSHMESTGKETHTTSEGEITDRTVFESVSSDLENKNDRYFAHEYAGLSEQRTVLEAEKKVQTDMRNNRTKVSESSAQTELTTSEIAESTTEELHDKGLSPPGTSKFERLSLILRSHDENRDEPLKMLRKSRGSSITNTDLTLDKKIGEPCKAEGTSDVPTMELKVLQVGERIGRSDDSLESSSEKGGGGMEMLGVESAEKSTETFALEHFRRRKFIKGLGEEEPETSLVTQNDLRRRNSTGSIDGSKIFIAETASRCSMKPRETNEDFESPHDEHELEKDDSKISSMSRDVVAGSRPSEMDSSTSEEPKGAPYVTATDNAGVVRKFSVYENRLWTMKLQSDKDTETVGTAHEKEEKRTSEDSENQRNRNRKRWGEPCLIGGIYHAPDSKDGEAGEESDEGDEIGTSSRDDGSLELQWMVVAGNGSSDSEAAGSPQSRKSSGRQSAVELRKRDEVEAHKELGTRSISLNNDVQQTERPARLSSDRRRPDSWNIEANLESFSEAIDRQLAFWTSVDENNDNINSCPSEITPYQIAGEGTMESPNSQKRREIAYADGDKNVKRNIGVEIVGAQTTSKVGSRIAMATDVDNPFTSVTRNDKNSSASIQFKSSGIPMDADDFSPTGRNSSAINSFNGSYEEDRKSLSRKTSAHRRQWEKDPCKVSTELSLDICQSEDVLEALETRMQVLRGSQVLSKGAQKYTSRKQPKSDVKPFETAILADCVRKSKGRESERPVPTCLQVDVTDRKLSNPEVQQVFRGKPEHSYLRPDLQNLKPIEESSDLISSPPRSCKSEGQNMGDKHSYNSKGWATRNVEELKAELLRHTRKTRHLERLLKDNEVTAVMLAKEKSAWETQKIAELRALESKSMEKLPTWWSGAMEKGSPEISDEMEITRLEALKAELIQEHNKHIKEDMCWRLTTNKLRTVKEDLSNQIFEVEEEITRCENQLGWDAPLTGNDNPLTCVSDSCLSTPSKGSVRDSKIVADRPNTPHRRGSKTQKRTTDSRPMKLSFRPEPPEGLTNRIGQGACGEYERLEEAMKISEPSKRPRKEESPDDYESMEEKLRIVKTREVVRVCSNEGKNENRKHKLPPERRPNSERIEEQVQQSRRQSHRPLHAQGHTTSEEMHDPTMANYLGKQPRHKTRSGNFVDRSIKTGKVWCSHTPPRRRIRRSSFKIPRIRGGSDASGVDCEYEDHQAITYPAKRFWADEDIFFHPIPAVTMKKSHEKFSGDKVSAAEDHTPQYPYIQSINQGIKVRYKWKAPLAPAEESDCNPFVDNQKRPPEKKERRDARSQPNANLHNTYYPDTRGRSCGPARGMLGGLNEIQDAAAEPMKHRASWAPRCSGGYKDKGGHKFDYPWMHATYSLRESSVDDVASSSEESQPHASKDSEGRQGDTTISNLWKSSPSSDTASIEREFFYPRITSSPDSIPGTSWHAYSASCSPPRWVKPKAFY